MKMQATLGHPILIAIYSTALLFIGCGVGAHWTHALPTALRLCIAGGILMAAHDLAMGFVWFWLTARWVRSVMTQRDTAANLRISPLNRLESYSPDAARPPADERRRIG